MLFLASPPCPHANKLLVQVAELRGGRLAYVKVGQLLASLRVGCSFLPHWHPARGGRVAGRAGGRGGGKAPRIGCLAKGHWLHASAHTGPV